MVRTIHNTNNPSDEYHKMRRLFAISKAVKEYTKEQGYESELVENGIPVGSFICKERSREASQPFHIVQIGRLHVEQKGQHILVAAMEKLVKEKHVTNFVVHFIGEGDDEEMLRQSIKDKGIEKYFIFEGVKSQDYLKDHLKDYDLLVQPSLYEGFGLTVAEALAAKLPVLVSDIEGPKEIIGNGKYGMSFRSNNPDDLASSIHAIILHGYSKMKIEEAYAMVSEKFDISQTADKYLLAYHDILST
jgi:glycosyltransferase involved in cell wall biosynthesis